MDSPKDTDELRATPEKDAASATGNVLENTEELVEGAPGDNSHTQTDSEGDATPLRGGEEECADDADPRRREQDRHSVHSSPEHQQTISHLQQHHQQPLPGHQPDLELRQEHLFSSNSDSDVFGAGDPDLEQLYRMSAHRFAGGAGGGGGGVGGPENHYDDLPLSFSFPYSEDENAKVYSCNVCNFKTAFKNSLVNHQAVHSDARPWICEVCDYAAKRKQDLKKHLQTMHGMIVDSLVLKPVFKFNPPDVPVSSASSSGLASPVDTKPVIFNNAVVTSDPSGSSDGLAGPHTNVSSRLSQQQAMLGLGQPLPSTAKLNQAPRSLPVPAVGKFVSDKFPFNQFYGEGTLPRFSAETFRNQMPVGSRELSKSEKEGACSSSLQRFTSLNDRIDQTLDRKDPFQNEDRNGRPLPPVGHVLSKDRLYGSYFSDEQSNKRSPETAGGRHPDSISREVGQRSDAHSSSSRVSSFSEEAGVAQRWKRASGDYSGERSQCADQSTPPAKAARFLSPGGSDAERSHLVSSGSDHIVSAEPISSTVSQSRSLDTRKSFHCAHCDILFFENALYLMHMGLHDNSNPWKCSICGRTFFEKYSFTSHFINQH